MIASSTESESPKCKSLQSTNSKQGGNENQNRLENKTETNKNGTFWLEWEQNYR